MKNASKALAGSLIALAALAGSSAFAQAVNTYGDPQQAHGTDIAVSQASRADVKAAYLQALHDGTLPPFGDTDVGYKPTFVSTASRADVHAGAVVAARVSASTWTDKQQAHGVDIASLSLHPAASGANLQARAEGGDTLR